MKNFPFFKQHDEKDCGPTCLKIIAKHYKKVISQQQMREISGSQRSGSSLLGLSNAAETIGFNSLGVKVNIRKLKEAPLPCILHWNKTHFIVLFKIKSDIYFVSDPAHGLLKYTQEEFLQNWIGNNATIETEEGIALLLEPTSKFYDCEFENKEQNLGFIFLSTYILKYKSFIVQLILGLIAASLLQLIFPFLTQSIVDVGIKNQDIHFI
ncbi:MAG: peptidase, partial [Ignavibacteriae bacterium]|nr:peptidase [Ignavibacteriota bacterium]